MSDPADLPAPDAELARLADLIADPSTPPDARAQLRARLALLQQQAAAQRLQHPAG